MEMQQQMMQMIPAMEIRYEWYEKGKELVW